MPVRIRIVARAASLFVAALALSGCLGGARSIGDGIDDTMIGTAVRQGMLGDRRFDYGDVDVTVYEARVLLTGTMRTDEGRREMAKLAWKRSGVAEVLNEIEVAERTPVGQGARDAAIHQSIVASLTTDGGVAGKNIKLAVSGGVVHMIGIVRDDQELERAVYRARTIRGVEKVVSHLQFADDPTRKLR
ncbi:MAG: BON domain-containing protein [Pseudomonadota bacterium]